MTCCTAKTIAGRRCGRLVTGRAKTCWQHRRASGRGRGERRRRARASPRRQSNRKRLSGGYTVKHYSVQNPAVISAIQIEFPANIRNNQALRTAAGRRLGDLIYNYHHNYM